MARTTINLDPQLLRQLRRRAAAEGRSLQAVVNDVLRQGLGTRREQPFTLTLKPWKTTVQPGVDLADRDSLFDLMNGR